MVCIGCLLAFVSRNMDPKFGEPKQMIFSMYNIAFTGVILIALFLAVDIEEDGRRMLQGIGIFWGTIVSSAAICGASPDASKCRWRHTHFRHELAYQ